VYGRTVETIAADEGAAYGAAILAGVGAGAWKSVDEAVDAIVRRGTTTSADAESVAVMEERYAHYRRVYPALRSISESTGPAVAQGFSPAVAQGFSPASSQP
jgi:xylulokinase